MKIGNLDASAYYIGSSTASKIYLGTDEVYGSAPPVSHLSITWDTLSGASQFDVIGGTAEYTNDGGATWSTLSIGEDQPLAVGPGPYEIKDIQGLMTNCAFNSTSGSSKVVGDMVVTGGSKLTSCDRMFYKCSNLTSVDLTNFDTSNVTTMNRMFFTCSKLSSVDLTNLDTSKVTDMSYMFNGCSKLTSMDLTNLDTSNVTTMASMFYSCSNLTSMDLTDLNVPKVTDMSSMFYSCSNLTSVDFTGSNTSSVTTMSSMFYSCSKLSSVDFTGSNTSAVTNMSSMFNGCSGLTSTDFTNLDTSAVTTMSYMFNGCSGLTSIDFTGLDMLAVTTMSFMFSGCSGLTSIDFTGLDMLAVTDMSSLLYGCTGFISMDLTGIVTSGASLSDMLRGCTNVETIQMFDTSLVTNFDSVFRDCTSLTCIDKINTTNQTNVYKLFDNTPLLVQPDAAAITDITDANGANWVNPGACLPPPSFKNFDMTMTSISSPIITPVGGTLAIDDNGDGTWHVWSDDNITSIGELVSAGPITKIQVNSAESLVDCYQMFKNMTALTEVHTGAWTGLNATRIFAMFRDSGVVHLYLPNFTPVNAETYAGLFRCPSLICVDHITLKANVARANLFADTVNLVQPDATVQADFVSSSIETWTNPGSCP